MTSNLRYGFSLLFDPMAHYCLYWDLQLLSTNQIKRCARLILPAGVRLGAKTASACIIISCSENLTGRISSCHFAFVTESFQFPSEHSLAASTPWDLTFLPYIKTLEFQVVSLNPAHNLTPLSWPAYVKTEVLVLRGDRHRIRSIQNDQQAIRHSSVIFVAPYWQYRISCLSWRL